MRHNVNLISTGISLIDNTWGGFYRGGTYITIGGRKSGKTLLGLQFAKECALNKEVCLYFTNMRPKDLMIQASSIDFDLQNAMNQNLVIVVRVAVPSDLYASGNPDSFLVEYLNDIVTVVDQYQPNCLVFDELTHFVGFENVGLLQQNFLKNLEDIQERNVTSLFILAEPATPYAQLITDSVTQYSTGVVYLQRIDAPGKNLGRATITPNVGHTEGQFISNYQVEPYVGLTFEYQKENSYENPYTVEPEANTGNADMPSPRQNPNSKYRPLTNVDVVKDKISFSNLYDYSEFTLILNNQIALFKSTGQPFLLISLKLDPIAEKQKILTINQLQNAVRLSTDKKDKICVVEDKIIVLMSKGEDKSLNHLVAKIKSNLPNQDANYLSMVTKYIFAFEYEVDETVENAEKLIADLIEQNR